MTFEENIDASFQEGLTEVILEKTLERNRRLVREAILLWDKEGEGEFKEFVMPFIRKDSFAVYDGLSQVISFTSKVKDEGLWYNKKKE